MILLVHDLIHDACGVSFSVMHDIEEDENEIMVGDNLSWELWNSKGVLVTATGSSPVQKKL